MEPLARKLEAPIFVPLDVSKPGELEAVFERIASEWGELDVLVHSIAWAQNRPKEGAAFRDARSSLAKKASKLLPFVDTGKELEGLAKRRYKMRRYLVPHAAISARKWASLVD